MADPITVAEILERTTAYFQQKGLESPRLDAQLLIGHALKKSRLQLYVNFDYPLNERELAVARELVRRRAQHEPVAYIIGEKEFAGRPFKVAPGVLVPRPDTEVLVEIIQRELGEDASGRLLEFGIGSGAIALTLAANNPQLEVVATEISAVAAGIAQENARALDVADRVQILQQGDFAGIDGQFQALVSNPPYISQDEAPTLAPDILRHEPHEALFAELNGLQWYRFLASEAHRLVVPGGFLAVEIGHTQREAVESIFRDAGLQAIASEKDYASNDRVVTGRV